MTISKTIETDKIIFALNGRLDTVTAPLLQDDLISALGEVSEVVLDFTALVYISSAGLRVLLVGLKTAIAKGSSMTISNVSDDIMEVFKMTGFSGMLNII